MNPVSLLSVIHPDLRAAEQKFQYVFLHVPMAINPLGHLFIIVSSVCKNKETESFHKAMNRRITLKKSMRWQYSIFYRILQLSEDHRRLTHAWETLQAWWTDERSDTTCCRFWHHASESWRCFYQTNEADYKLVQNDQVTCVHLSTNRHVLSLLLKSAPLTVSTDSFANSHKSIFIDGIKDAKTQEQTLVHLCERTPPWLLTTAASSHSSFPFNLTTISWFK